MTPLALSQILLATTNSGKIREFQHLLKNSREVFSPRDARFADIRVPDVEENGLSYFENALKKALAFHSTYQVPVLADDSGLEVDVLDGRPGVFSARLAGEKASWAERWSELYRMLRPFPAFQWTAQFRCVLCYYDGVSVPRFFEGSCEGMILSSPRGEGGFGYDPIFLSKTLGKSFAEASAEEKASTSHRALAVAAFLNEIP